MRRWALAGAIAILGGSLLTTQLASGATPLRTSARAGLQMFACRGALKASKRVVSVTAVMRPVTGTVKLRMRFQLMSDAGGQVGQVRGGDLGTWISPQPSTLGQDPKDVWIVRHPVNGTAVPADYRFKVSFRWVGADHRAIATATRWSQTCWQPDMRPDLLVQSINVNPIPGDAAHNQYVALIANDGLTAARSFDVLFAPGDGTAGQTVTIPRLSAQSTQSETFIGPACTTAAAPTITVDPGHHVSDLDPANNSLLATCPPSTPAPQSAERGATPRLN